MTLSPSPKVSVLMPAYKTAAYIGESIESIQAQTYSNWELIIIDDGSPDAMEDAVAPYLGDRRVSYHRFSNGGASAARNRGLAIATGELVALLDSDDLYDPDYLALAVEAFGTIPDLTFVTSDAVMFGTPSREGRLYSEFESQRGALTLDRVLAREFNVSGAAIMSASDLRAVGGFNERQRSAEDFDLWTRLLMRGKPAHYFPRPLLRYRRRHGSLSTETAPMLLAQIRVYADRLGELSLDSATASVCLRRIEACVAGIERANGERAIRQGDLRAAAAFLSRSDIKPYWRPLLWLMRAAPGLAKAVLAWRNRRNERTLGTAA